MPWKNLLGLGACVLGFGTLFAAACSSSSSPPGNPTSSDVLRSDLPQDTHPNVSGADYQTFLDDNAAFAFDLYGKLAAQGDANIVFSPLSASVALAMAYAGAKWQTATQMAAALHFALPPDKLNPAFDKLALELAALGVAPHSTDFGEKSVTLDLVNALWAQRGLSVVSSFLDTLAVDYDAGVRVLDFAGDPAARATRSTSGRATRPTARSADCSARTTSRRT
jgi:serine protease inhibitor